LNTADVDVIGVKKTSPCRNYLIEELSQSSVVGKESLVVSNDKATTSSLLYKPKACLAAALSSSVINSLRKFS
jgi:hypothetical protein